MESNPTCIWKLPDNNSFLNSSDLLVTLTKTKIEDLVYNNCRTNWIYEITYDYESSYNKCSPKYVNTSSNPILEWYSAENIIHNFESLFPLETLKKLLVNYILFEDVTFVSLPKNNILWIEPWNYLLKENDFNSLSEKVQNIISNYIYRAWSTAWDRKRHEEYEKWKIFFPTPIVLFSLLHCNFVNWMDNFNDDELESKWLSYILDVPQNLRKLVYVLGTLSHEVWHHIYEYHISENEELINELNSIVDKYWDITWYVIEYRDDRYQYLNETIAEATRLYTTSNKYFKNKYPDLYNFLYKILENNSLEVSFFNY